jgi:hypothetical protein
MVSPFNNIKFSPMVKCMNETHLFLGGLFMDIKVPSKYTFFFLQVLQEGYIASCAHSLTYNLSGRLSTMAPYIAFNVVQNAR